MEKSFKVIHINSTTKDRYPTVDGQLNSEPIIEKGEIAVNGAEGGEFLAIVNTANKIKTFKDWDTTKNEIDKKSYVWDISVLPIGGGVTLFASQIKPIISKHLQGIPLFMYNGRNIFPLHIQTDGENWHIYAVSLNQEEYLHRFVVPYDVLNYNDDYEIEIFLGGDSPYTLVNETQLYDYIKKSETYTKSEIDEKVLTIKEFTLEGTEGELPLSEWDSLVNSDIYLLNGTYIYSHIVNGDSIHFDIVTNLVSGGSLLVSTTIAFYNIQKLEDKLTWNYVIYKGNLVEDVVEEFGENKKIVMSQKAVTEQFALTNNNVAQLQDTVNTINNNYRKKVVSISSTETSKTIDANTYYKWGTMSTLTISLNTNVDSSILNEYMFEFASGSTPTTLSLPSSIKWLNGLTPIIQANKTYQVSIVNNLGVIAEFA